MSAPVAPGRPSWRSCVLLVLNVSLLGGIGFALVLKLDTNNVLLCLRRRLRRLLAGGLARGGLDS